MFSNCRMSRCFLAVTAAFALSASINSYSADTAHQGHASSKKSGTASPSMEMHRAMSKGMKEMQRMKSTGHVDHDFAMMMRLHHIQALDMAEAELKHGKDQKMRDMAQKIIEAQKKEIAEFDEWLKAHPHASSEAHK